MNEEKLIFFCFLNIGKQKNKQHSRRIEHIAKICKCLKSFFSVVRWFLSVTSYVTSLLIMRLPHKPSTTCEIIEKNCKLNNKKKKIKVRKIIATSIEFDHIHINSIFAVRYFAVQIWEIKQTKKNFDSFFGEYLYIV